LGRIYNRMGRFGLLGRRLWGAARKTPPPYGIQCQHPLKRPQNRLRQSLFGGRGRVEMLSWLYWKFLKEGQKMLRRDLSISSVSKTVKVTITPSGFLIKVHAALSRNGHGEQ
jgi:hypothetical protein